MITGEFRCSLDEKGRLLIPARMRAEVMGNVVILTRGVENCLWFFPPEEWKSFSEKLILLEKRATQLLTFLLRRRLLAMVIAYADASRSNLNALGEP